MHRISKLSLRASIALVACSSTAHADTFFLNYEAPGIQNTTATFTTVGVETFDGRINRQSFLTDFGTGGKINATYSPVLVFGADQYGGAGGLGSYAAAFNGFGYSLKFTADPAAFPNGVNYFGYWLSALDGGNQVTFYNKGRQVGQLTPTDVLDRIGGNSAYFGNPTTRFAGQNGYEPYAFINFYDLDGSFDEVRFAQITGGGYESDNHTVGFYTAFGGVPEPATWALMIAGFGVVGAAMRSQRQKFAPCIVKA